MWGVCRSVVRFAPQGEVSVPQMHMCSEPATHCIYPPPPILGAAGALSAHAHIPCCEGED